MPHGECYYCGGPVQSGGSGENGHHCEDCGRFIAHEDCIIRNDGAREDSGLLGSTTEIYCAICRDWKEL